MVMKIENYEGSADTFTFPHNPNTFDDEITGNAQFTNINYQKQHIVVGGGGIVPKSIILSGHFDGSTKETNYLALSKHFSQNDKLKKLYWDSTKFYLGVGETIRKTHTGGKTNFIDYAANFRTILGILLGDTESTSGVNSGNVRTFITEVTGTITSGASDVTIEDNHGNKIRLGSAVFSTGNAFKLEFVSMIDSGGGINVSEYNIATIGGTQTSRLGTDTGTGILVLDAGENVSTITTTNLTSAVVKFRNGYSA